MELTDTTRSSYHSLIRNICNKLGIDNNSHPNLKRVKIQELTEEILKHDDSIELKPILTKSDVDEKIRFMRALRENKQIADKVKGDDKKIAIVEAIENNPELTNKILELIAQQNPELEQEPEGR